MSNTNDLDAGQVDIQGLATLVAGMSRFLTRLSKLAPFEEAGFGLAEWSALSIIANKSGLNNRQLAHALGVSAQRVNQITESLKAGKLISFETSTDDARKKIVSITAVGNARLKQLNEKLQPIIATAMNKQTKTLGRVSGMVNRTLMRIVASPKLRTPGNREMRPRRQRARQN